MSKDYVPLHISTALSTLGLQEAMRITGPSFVYQLIIAPSSFDRAKRLLKEIGAQNKNNPFSPYVNIMINPELDPGEWVLVGQDAAAGSNFKE